MNMANIPLPAFNIDRLEGAVQHALMLGRTLSDDALNAFVQKYAFAKGKHLPPDYATTELLPRMKHERKVYQTTKHLYSLSPFAKLDEKALNAFWVFLYSMDGVQMEYVLNGPFPAQISYIKNGRIYHIIVCDGDGRDELGLAAQLEVDTSKKRRKANITPVDERFFFVFTSKENADNAPLVLDAPTLFVTIEYPNGSYIPKLNFIDPRSSSMS